MSFLSSVAMSRRSLGGLPALVVRWPPVPVRWRFEGWWRQRSCCCRTWKRPWCSVLASWPTAITDGTWRCSSQSWMLITGRSAGIRMEAWKDHFKEKNRGWFLQIVMYMSTWHTVYDNNLYCRTTVYVHVSCVCIHLYIPTHFLWFCKHLPILDFELISFGCVCVYVHNFYRSI